MLPTELEMKIKKTYSGEMAAIFDARERDLIRDEMKKLIGDELDCAPGMIGNDTDFSDLGMDSVSFLQVVDELKRSIGLPIPTGQLMSFSANTRATNVNAMVELVIAFLSKQGNA